MMRIKDGGIKQLQLILEGYTDQWIGQQHPAERGSLRTERRELEHQLAESMAARARARTRRPVLSLYGR